MEKPLCSNSRVITANFLGVRIFRSFMVCNLQGRERGSQKEAEKFLQEEKTG